MKNWVRNDFQKRETKVRETVCNDLLYWQEMAMFVIPLSIVNNRSNNHPLSNGQVKNNPTLVSANTSSDLPFSSSTETFPFFVKKPQTIACSEFLGMYTFRGLINLDILVFRAISVYLFNYIMFKQVLSFYSITLFFNIKIYFIKFPIE